MPTFARQLEIMALVGVVLSMGCARDTVAVNRDELRARASEFVPADASRKVDASGIPWVQISFDVQREPLDFAVTEDRLAKAKSDGWMLCEPKSAEWSGYYDATTTPPNRYKQIREYMLYRAGVVITLVGTYESDSESTSVKKVPGQTTKPTQHGFVIAHASSEKDAFDFAAKQGLSCHR
jgi:hypothetical protein